VDIDFSLQTQQKRPDWVSWKPLALRTWRLCRESHPVSRRWIFQVNGLFHLQLGATRETANRLGRLPSGSVFFRPRCREDEARAPAGYLFIHSGVASSISPVTMSTKILAAIGISLVTRAIWRFPLLCFCSENQKWARHRTKWNQNSSVLSQPIYPIFQSAVFQAISSASYG
jgi:hypothetical protein